MADVQAILSDPDFRASSPETQREILSVNDADFAQSSRTTQDEILQSFRRPSGTGAAHLTGGREVVIKRPPTITDYVRAGLRQAVTEGVPILGAIGGGLVGAPLGPLPALAGAGLGYAGGRQLVRTGIEAGLIAGPRPSEAPIQQQLANIGMDVLTGATIEAGGPVTLELAKRGVAFAKGPLGLAGATPEDLAVRAAAARQQIPMTAATASGSEPVALIESVPARFPVGRQTVVPTATRTQAAAQRAAERLSAGLGPAKTLEQAGKSVQEEIGTIARAQENAPTALVDNLIEAIGTSQMPRQALGGSLKEAAKGVELSRRRQASRIYQDAIAGRGMEEVTLQTTNRVATNIMALETRLTGIQTRAARPAAGLQQQSTAAPLDPSGLTDAQATELIRLGGREVRAAMQSGQPIDVQALPRDFIERYGLSQYGRRTLEETIAIQQRLGALARNATDDVVRRQLKTLHDAVSDDIRSFGAGTALEDAARFYRTEVAMFFARKAPVRRLLDREPGAVADKILSTTSPDLLQQTMKVLPPRQQAELQRAVMERIKQRALDPRTGEVSPSRLEAELVKFGDENLGIVFGARRRAIDDLRNTMHANFGRDTTHGELARLITAQPEGIVNSLARGKIKSLDDFDAVWRTLSPSTRQEVRSSLYNEVLGNAFDPKTGRFSIDRFVTDKEKVPQEIWDRMLAGNPAAALRDIELVFRRIARFNQVAANPSQTGAAVLGPAQVLGFTGLAASTAFGREDPESFSTKFLGLLSPVALGLLVFSRGGQRMLTSQPARPVNPRGLPATGLKLIGAIGAQSANPNAPPIPMPPEE